MLTIFLSRTGMAQDARIKLIWEEEEEEVFFSGKLHRLKCEFTTDEDIQVKLIIIPETPLKLLSPSSYKIDSKKEEINSSSIKLYLPQTGSGIKDSLNCKIILQSMDNEFILGEEKICLEIKERIVIRLEPLRSQIPIRATDSLAQIPIKVKNMGRRKYKVEVALQNKPQGLKIMELKKVFMLRPRHDTLINFNVRPDKNWQKTHSAFLKYNLTILKNSEEVADCKISAFPMGHVKKYYHPQFTINNTHEFGLGIQSRGATQKIINFSSKGTSPLFKGLLNYQLQPTFYTNPREIIISNSFLNYSTNKKSFTIGHVNYNDEASLSGRGFVYEIKRDSQYIHFGFINGSYKLFDPSLALNTQTGNSLFGGFRKTTQRMGLIESNAIIRLRQFSNTGLFWMTNTIDKKRNYLSFRLGFSGGQDKALSSNPSIYSGLSLSADYEKEARNWNFQSTNHFSTSRYGGNIPGILYSKNQLEFLVWNRLTVKASIKIQNSKNFVWKNDDKYERFGKILMYQFQFETIQTGRWKLIVKPSLMFDTRNYIELSQPADFYGSKSSRIKITLNRKKGNFSLLWKSDIGSFKFGKVGAIQQQFLYYRFGFRLSNKNLSFNSTYNQGSTRLSNAVQYEQVEAINSFAQFGVLWGKWFFKRKVKANISNQLTYNSIRNQWTNSSAVKIKSILAKGLTLDTELVFFNTGNFTNLYWNVKLMKKIKSYRPPSGSKKLKIVLFEDVNNNGIQEGTEQTLPGIFVQIDRIPFVTNENGWVQYKSIPIGEYTISIIDPNGKFTGKRQTIRVENNEELTLPLYKTIRLAGIVNEIKVRFKSTKFDLLGIPIVAKNIQEQTVITYTQPDGSFAFNLPENEYTVYIDPAAFDKNFEFPDNFKKVVLSQNEETDISLSVKVKSRKMTIQNF